MSSTKTSSSPSSSSSVGHNEDLMAQIALYLPVKSILRFRSVSKQWYSLLNHPHFIKRYASNKSRNSMLFFPRGDASLHINRNNNNLDFACFNYLQNPSQEDTLDLISSCNGLLLLESNNWFVKGQPGTGRPRFYVCNPSTRKHSELALPDYIASVKGSVIADLAFDPSKSPFYKVVFFWNSDPHARDASDSHIFIYSSETKACREVLRHSFDGNPIPFFRRRIFYNGAIWWPNYFHTSWSYFDIDQHSISNVSPKGFDDPRYGARINYIGAYGDHFYMLLSGPTAPLEDVFELKDDYSEWVAKYKIDFDAIAVDFPQIIDKNQLSLLRKRHYVYSVLCVLDKEEEEEEASIVLLVGRPRDDQLILAYNFADKTTKKLRDIPSDGNPNRRMISWNRAFHCTESLFGV